MQIIGHARAVLLILALNGCADQVARFFPATDPRIDQAPLNEDSRRQARAYFGEPNAKAFAFDPKSGTNWHAWGYSSVDQAKQIALSKCEELTKQRCAFFAVNDEIVWQPPTPR